MKIDDKNWKIPKYIQLREHIKSLITERALKPHSKLPTWAELMSLHGLSDTTVRKAVDELETEGYLYRIQGKGTFVAERKKEYPRIGLIVPELGIRQRSVHKFYLSDIAELVYSIQEEARNRQANLILYLNAGNVEVERLDLQNILDGGADAAIVLYTGGSENTDCLERMLEVGIPMVMIDRYEQGVPADYVVTDNFSGAHQAVSALLESGFAPVFHITIACDVSSVNERLRGYRQAMADHGLPTDDLIRSLPEDDPDRYTKALESHIREISTYAHSRVGIFAVHERVLEHVWKALQEYEPAHDHIALSCFDDPPIDIPENVMFVKVAQPTQEIGSESVQIICGKLNGDVGPHQVVLRPDVIIVNSGARPRSGATRLARAGRKAAKGKT